MRSKTSAKEHAIKPILGTLAVLTAMSIMAGPSAADERDHRHGAERERHENRRPQAHRFNHRDHAHWRAGRWHHGDRAGRSGWWWIVGPAWYFYPAPVYPYPDPYVPPLVQAPRAAPATQYWYYCTHPPGYYPTVPECRVDWQRVPATVLPGVVP